MFEIRQNASLAIPSKKYLQDRYGISVHFSSVHSNYFTAWKYVTKEDGGAVQSENHPDLTNSVGPSTMKAHKAKHAISMRSREKEKRNKAEVSISAVQADEHEEADKCGERPKVKRQRLKSFDVAEIIVSKGIKSRTDLLALAHEQKTEGKSDLAEFIVNRGNKVVDEIINTAWEMETAKCAQARSKKSRLEILQEAGERECTCNPNENWLLSASALLEKNGILHDTFASSVRELLIKGRGKYRNIMLTGPANCGKTFLLNPLNNIFQTFTNPASTSFAWVGAEKAEIIFLNDFRWSTQIIPWHDLLLMLEGQVVHLPAPKSHFAHDAVFNKDTPIFCTTKHQLVYVKNGIVDERETEMMCVRWKMFALNYQIPRQEQREIKPCGACFHDLYLTRAKWY